MSCSSRSAFSGWPAACLLVLSSLAGMPVPSRDLAPPLLAPLEHGSGASAGFPVHSARPAGATLARAAVAFERLPLSFEANRGQADARVRFLTRGPGYTLFLTPEEAVLSLRKRQSAGGKVNRPGTDTTGAPPPAPGSPVATVRMRLGGTSRVATLEGCERLPGVAHYYLGRDPRQWRTNIPTYQKVRSRDVYPGIDLVYYGNRHAAASRLEYDFIVAPGADPRQVRLEFEGTQTATLDRNGDLVLETPAGQVRQHRPIVYQVVNGERRVVDGGYALKDEGGRMKDEPSGTGTFHPSSLILHPFEVAFTIGSYDRSRPLIIDPVLSYSTYLGGTDNDQGAGIAVDAARNLYVAGTTRSTDFPTAASAFQDANQGFEDAFVVKLNEAGSAILYSTYLGGAGIDYAQGLAVDTSGNAYVTGFTVSADFPTTPGALRTGFGGIQDGFVTQLNATGAALVYSTYLGGAGQDGGTGIAADASGNAFVTGYTGSPDFPVAATAAQPLFAGGGLDAFVVRLGSDGARLLYGSYLGGRGTETGAAIALDRAGSAYVAGATGSPDFPVTAGAFQRSFRGGALDGFVSKVNAAASGPASLAYSTFLGAAAADRANGIAVDARGSACVTGTTASASFPVLGTGPGRLFGGITDAFVARLNPLGTALVYFRYLGGSGADQGNAVAVDPLGNAYVVGVTSSPDFPSVTSLHGLQGSADAFVTKLNPGGTALSYSTYLGGMGYDEARAVVAEPAGNACVTGLTGSLDFDLTPGALQPARLGTFDAFITRVPQLVPAPAMPTELRVSRASDTSLTLAWRDNSTDETGFELERRTGTAPFARIQILPPGTTSFSDTGLTPNTIYVYRLRAIGPGGASDYSGELAAQTPPTPVNTLAARPQRLKFRGPATVAKRGKTVRIRNTGDAPVQVTVALQDLERQFALRGATSFTIEPGDVGAARVQFQPTHKGRFTAELRITGMVRGGQGQQQLIVTLKGLATPKPGPPAM